MAKRKKAKSKKPISVYHYEAKQKSETTDFIIQVSGMSVAPTDNLSIYCKIPNRILRRMK